MQILETHVVIDTPLSIAGHVLYISISIKLNGPCRLVVWSLNLLKKTRKLSLSLSISLSLTHTHTNNQTPSHMRTLTNILTNTHTNTRALWVYVYFNSLISTFCKNYYQVQTYSTPSWPLKNHFVINGENTRFGWD